MVKSIFKKDTLLNYWNNKQVFKLKGKANNENLNKFVAKLKELSINVYSEKIQVIYPNVEKTKNLADDMNAQLSLLSVSIQLSLLALVSNYHIDPIGE